MQITKQIIIQSWHLTLEMGLYLMIGLLAAGILHVFVSVEKVAKHLGKDSLLSIFKASIPGIPIPLCSCSVLPVATSIRKAGAGKSATLSFLLTSQTPYSNQPKSG